MLDDPEKIHNQKPFRIAQYLLPNTLELLGQLQFLNVLLRDAELIFYANLPDGFRRVALEDVYINDYSQALSKLNELLDLLANTNASTLNDSIEIAVDSYRESHIDDYVGLEVVSLGGKLFVNIHNGEELILQVQLEDTGVCWGIEKFIIHYQLFGYRLELRDNLRGKQTVIIQPPSEEVNIFPTLRDRTAIAGIQFLDDSDEPLINLYDYRSFIEDNQEKVMHDFFTISPQKIRIINIYSDNIRNEEIVATEHDGAIKLDRNIVEKEQLPTAVKETFSMYRADVEAAINIDGDDLRTLAIDKGALHKRLTVVKKVGSFIPISTKAEYFGNNSSKSIEIRFKDGLIDAAVLDDRVYLYGEFSMHLTPEGYYILVFEDTMERVSINFTPDFSISIANIEVKPVFDVVNKNIDLPVSNFYNLAQRISLN